MGMVLLNLLMYTYSMLVYHISVGVLHVLGIENKRCILNRELINECGLIVYQGFPFKIKSGRCLWFHNRQHLMLLMIYD